MEKINKQIGRKIVVDALSPSYGFEKNEEKCHIINDSGQKSSGIVV